MLENIKVCKNQFILQHYNKFLQNNIDEKIATSRIENFFRTYLLTISRNSEEYVDGIRSPSRKVLVYLMKLILLIIGLRFLVSSR